MDYIHDVIKCGRGNRQGGLATKHCSTVKCFIHNCARYIQPQQLLRKKSICLTKICTLHEHDFAFQSVLLLLFILENRFWFQFSITDEINC